MKYIDDILNLLFECVEDAWPFLLYILIIIGISFGLYYGE